MNNIYVMDCFEEVETISKHEGYFYKVSDVIKIVILGSLCGLKNMKRIFQWANDAKVRDYLKEKFEIERIPCYYWMIKLLGIVKPESLSECFTRWVSGFMPEYRGKDNSSERNDTTVSVDGKTIRSTGKMGKTKNNPLHIVSAQLTEIGLTFGQRAVDSKSNEIPAAQKLLRELDIRGCLVVADALNCQEETARIIIEGEADYLLCAKDNQEKTKEAVKENIHDEKNKGITDTATSSEKNHGRNETRTAYTIPYNTLNIDGILNQKWQNIACIGAICREVEINGNKSEEWHYYISSRILTAQELLRRARMEWAVETMHWILDVDFGEDSCRIEDRNIQQSLNTFRKISLNIIKLFKRNTASKTSITEIMFSCLMNPYNLVYGHDDIWSKKSGLNHGMFSYSL